MSVQPYTRLFYYGEFDFFDPQNTDIFDSGKDLPSPQRRRTYNITSVYTVPQYLIASSQQPPAKSPPSPPLEGRLTPKLEE